MTWEGLKPLRESLIDAGLLARKDLGQHFLLDLNLTSKIAALAGDLSYGTVIEIGPGPGGLTRALLMRGARKVIALERDPRCVALLEPLEKLAQGRLQVFAEDALHFSVAALAEEKPFKIIANLPYNIGTALLINWLKEADHLSSLVLMFQKEVAERIVAAPGTKAYGRLAVICQARAQCKKHFDLNRAAFTPPPKVTSSVVSLIPYGPSDNPWEKEGPWCFSSLEQVTRAAFGQRRKMLKSALKQLFPSVDHVCGDLGLDSKKRAEELSVLDFIRLSHIFGKDRASSELN